MAKLKAIPFIVIYEEGEEKYPIRSWAIKRAKVLKEEKLECSVVYNGLLIYTWARLDPSKLYEEF
jgi:hypothetical protein